MHIAYDHQVFVQQRFGGISRYFAELASRLRAAGHDVAIVAPFHQNEYLLRPGVAPMVLGRKLTRGRFLSIGRLMRWGNRLALPHAWRARRPDILHETFFGSHVYGQCRARVLTVYDMIHELFPDQLAQADRHIAAKRAAVARADHIICISETTRRDLVQLLAVDPARTSVIYLGHSLAAPAGGSSVPDSPARPPFILHVGDRGSYKNFARAAEAFARNPRVSASMELLAFGGRPFSPRELAAFQSLGIATKVRHESGDDALLAARYRSARLFVCPSIYEGFGLPPLEAMAYGCPVACTDRGSVPEVVGDAGEYFDPLEVDSIGAALERLCFDESRRTELISLGRARAAQFTWARCASETTAAYQRLL